MRIRIVASGGDSQVSVMRLGSKVVPAFFQSISSTIGDGSVNTHVVLAFRIPSPTVHTLCPCMDNRMHAVENNNVSRSGRSDKKSTGLWLRCTAMLFTQRFPSRGFGVHY